MAARPLAIAAVELLVKVASVADALAVMPAAVVAVEVAVALASVLAVLAIGPLAIAALLLDVAAASVRLTAPDGALATVAVAELVAAARVADSVDVCVVSAVDELVAAARVSDVLPAGPLTTRDCDDAVADPSERETEPVIPAETVPVAVAVRVPSVWTTIPPAGGEASVAVDALVAFPSVRVVSADAPLAIVTPDDTVALLRFCVSVPAGALSVDAVDVAVALPSVAATYPPLGGTWIAGRRVNSGIA